MGGGKSVPIGLALHKPDVTSCVYDQYPLFPKTRRWYTKFQSDFRLLSSRFGPSNKFQSKFGYFKPLHVQNKIIYVISKVLPYRLTLQLA